MPRTPRLDFPGARHHVIARGVAQGDIHHDDLDRRRFLGSLSDLCAETGTRCLAWALLSNHYHLLLETGAAPISGVVHRLNTRHALRFNKRHGRVGHLFQNHSRSFLLDDEAYLLRFVG